MSVYRKRLSCIIPNDDKVKFIMKFKQEFPEFFVDDMLKYLIYEYMNKDAKSR